LMLALGPTGEQLASPRHVRFEAEMAHHLLHWEPGHNPPSDVRYEVEHTVYGTNLSWTAIPTCTRISGHSCDLTYYTLDPARRYYARVRAVSRNRTSSWERTNAFSPQEATLRLSGHSLSVTGNTVHVELQLLLRADNLTVRFEDIQKHATLYRVYIRKVQDNRTNKVVETVPKFNISNLFWDTEYCISVEPDVASRSISAIRTDERCITTGKRDRSAELVLSIVSSSFITVSLLGLLGALLVCTYVKKPMRPPSVLKSFIKQSTLWVEQESSSSSGSPDADPVQQLFLCQKEPQQDSSHNGSPGTAQLSPEKGWRPPAWPEDQVCLLGTETMGSGDSSCTSTDSGICLHTSSSSELSCSPGLEPQGYKQQLHISDDSGVGLETPCTHPTHSSSSRNTTLTEATQPHGQELRVPPATGQDSQQDLEFRGYLQQSKGMVELRQDPGTGMLFSGCAGTLQSPGNTDILLDIECAELAVAKGYLKQSSPEHPCSHLQDLAAWDFSSQVGPQAPTPLSYGAPGAPLASKVGPELLKAPFDLSIFNTDLLGMPPLISSLSTNEWLMLQINPPSLLNGESKDSRL
ncbi:I10R1 protein, partial [Nycticryphes semicollaris]|nr:I10R1 protein [Nycticryphes semicollaris]